MGLIFRAVPEASLIAEAEAICAKLARLPAKALAATKRVLDAAEGNTLDAQLDLEARAAARPRPQPRLCRGRRRLRPEARAALRGRARMTRDDRRAPRPQAEGTGDLNRGSQTMTPQALAEACANAMWAEDHASRGARHATPARRAPARRAAVHDRRPHMVNGHGICHGGYIFTLADSRLRLRLQQLQPPRRRAGTTPSPISAPPGSATSLTARGTRNAASAGRSGIYDVTVTDAGRPVVAELPRPFPRRSKAISWRTRHDRHRTAPDRSSAAPAERMIAAPRCARCSANASPGRCVTPTTTSRITAAPSTPAGVTPADFRDLRRPRRASPSPPRPTCAPTIPSACSPCRASRWRASTPPPAPPASPPSSATPSRTSTSGPRWSRARIRAAGGRPGMKVHVAYGYGLFTGGLGAHYGAEALGCTVIPMSGGMTERQVQLIDGFPVPTSSWSRRQLHARAARRVPEAGHGPARGPRCGSASSAPSPGPRRCGSRSRQAFDIARRRHLRAVGSDGPRRRQRMRRDQGRAACLGGPFLPGDHRPRDRRCRCRMASAASWSSPS